MYPRKFFWNFYCGSWVMAVGLTSAVNSLSKIVEICEPNTRIGLMVSLYSYFEDTSRLTSNNMLIQPKILNFSQACIKIWELAKKEVDLAFRSISGVSIRNFKSICNFHTQKSKTTSLPSFFLLYNITNKLQASYYIHTCFSLSCNNDKTFAYN